MEDLGAVVVGDRGEAQVTVASQFEFCPCVPTTVGKRWQALA